MRSIFLLFSLTLVVVAGCAVPKVKVPSFPDNSKIHAALGRVYVKPFDRQSLKKDIFYNLGTVETFFQDNLLESLNKSNLFDHTANESVQMTAELVSWDYTNGKIKTIINYSVFDEEDNLILEARIASENGVNPFLIITGAYRYVSSASKCFNKNIYFFMEQLGKNLKPRWIVYKNEIRKTLTDRVAGSGSYGSLTSDSSLQIREHLGLDLFGDYYALIIGNNNYQNLPKLKTATNDAVELSKILKEKYKFNVKMLINATRKDILRELNHYRSILKTDDNLLIYYAGHGWLDEAADEGYWLPVDADRTDPTNWISNASITTALKAMNAKHVLVISDSCYSGKLARGIHMTIREPNYFQRIAKKRCRTVLASGGLEPVADSGGGKHSVFASALLDVLSTNEDIIDATTIFEKIRRPVVLNSDQTPEYSDIRNAGHMGGDFLFISR